MEKINLDEIKKAIRDYDNEVVEPTLYNNSNPYGIEDSSAQVEKKNDNKKEKKSSEKVSPANTSKGYYSPKSNEYRQFRDEEKPVIHSWYEKVCAFAGSIMKIDPGKDDAEKLEKALHTADLNITPADSYSFAIIGPLIFMVIGMLFSIFVMNADLVLIAFFLLSGIGIMIPLTKLPYIMANTTRLKSSKEIVLSIFYIVTYMRQNSNLERAIEFAADHLSGPLANDFKKVLWDVEDEVYPTIKMSLDAYLEQWRPTNTEFLEAMNLIESSLYESSDGNRVAMLDKALDVILSQTYEKMLHYSHAIQSPISTLHMLGVILPILGLVILPLVIIFMENAVWYHIGLLYNIILPVSVYFVSMHILSNRPGGYGGVAISPDNPLVKEERKKHPLPLGLSPLQVSIIVLIFFMIIGLSPLILHQALGPGQDIKLFRNEYDENSGMKVLEYREAKSSTEENRIYKGPYSIIATVFGLCIPLGLGLAIGLYYYLISKDYVKVREQTMTLENEFSSAIYQLGNRLGDGIPLEMTFSKVVDVMQGSQSGDFFSAIDQNIRELGMSPEQAIFDKQRGAITLFPSALIISTMQVLTESIKKGPLIAAKAMSNVARYVKEMHQVEERLKDLMAEVISSMNSLIKFLAPVISGIVVGITSMITGIVGMLSASLRNFSSGAGGDAGQLAGLVGMFGDGIPTYFFQIIVGIYIVQVVFIISQAINGIAHGDDPIGEQNLIGTNLMRTIVIYTVVTLIVMVIFNTVAMSLLGNVISAEPSSGSFG